MDSVEAEVVFSSKAAERSSLLGKGRERKCSSIAQDESNENGGLNVRVPGASTDSLSSESHCHERKTKPDIDKRARRKLIIACVLSLVFMIGEVVGGIFAHSLAIVSDAAHLLTDLASFLISLLAIYLASRKATKKLSFGWYRAEILGALMSIIFLWVVTGVLCYMAVQRVINKDFEVDSTIMLITASCGVAFNLVMGLTLHPGGHGHSHGGSSKDNNPSSPYSSSDDDEEKLNISRTDSLQIPPHGSYGSVNMNESTGVNDENDGDTKVDSKKLFFLKGSRQDSEGISPLLSNVNQTSDEEGHSHAGGSHSHGGGGHSHKANINVKAAFVHVIGDLLQSIGVLVAAIIIYFRPEWKLADPICTFVFSVIVLVTTLTIMRDILVVLMEGTPRNVSFREILRCLRTIKEVQDVHDLRIWSLSMDKVAMSIHIAVSKDSDTLIVLKEATLMMQQRFGITETTIQVEAYVDNMLDCTHCRDPPD